MSEEQKNQVNIHWFQGSFSRGLLTDVINRIENFCTDNLWFNVTWDEKTGVNGYQRSLRYKNMIMVLFDQDPVFCKKVHNNKFSVCFTGEFFDNMPFEKLDLFDKIFSFLTVTRFDQYYQDINRIASIFEVYVAYKQGCVRGFTSAQYTDSYSRNTPKGETMDFGRRGSSGSGKSLCVYDKELESKGEIKGVRWEARWAGDRAVSAWKIWRRNNFSAASCFGMIFSTIDFIEPTKDNHKSRWQRLPWYQKLIDSSEPLPVPVVVKKSTISTKDGWVRNSVSRSLAYIRAFCMYIDGCSDGFDGHLDNYALEGAKKLRKSDLIQLKADIEQHLNEFDSDDLKVPSLSELEQFFKRAA